MKSPSDHDILVIDITNRCFLKCSNCTRDIAHQTHTREMTPETFRKALNSVRGWWKPGRVIGLIGGEPTLNKHFEDICRIFRDEFNPGALVQARHPIQDFNKYAHKRLFDRTNGKGLWTSFGPRFMDYYEIIADTFSHWNPNDHSAGDGVHQTSLVDAREMMDALGISWDKWPEIRDNCWLQNGWSASITPRGKAYFCERAAALDELYNNGDLGWDIEQEPDWWKRKPSEFGEQLSICERCSMALPGPGQKDSLDTDIISENHRIRLNVIGSPAVKRGQYELYDPEKHREQRKIERKDSYVAPSGIRVSNENEYIFKKKITAIVTCVGRADMLRQTLPINVPIVDELIIVTHPQDGKTKHVLYEGRGMTGKGNAYRLILSDRLFDNNASFNKGSLINDALATISNPDWILLTDADVFLNPRLPEYLKTHALNPGVLHGTSRLNAKPETIDQYGLESIWRKPTDEVGHCVDSEPNGYFQLFNYRAQAIRDRWPKVMSEAFCSAGGLDSWFLQQWPADKRVQIPEIPVIHIAHAPHLGAQWNGSKKPQTWRQCGMLTGRGYFPTENLPDGPLRLRLTDTKYAQSVTIEVNTDELFPPDVVTPDGNGGLIFQGQPIAEHIHVAYWNEGEK